MRAIMGDTDALRKNKDNNTDQDASLASSMASLGLDDPGPCYTGLGTLFEERDSPEKGIGIFAIAAIPSGSRILCEPPLFALSEYADIIELYDAVEKLPKKERSSFWALAGSTKPDKDVEWMSKLRSSHDGRFMPHAADRALANENRLRTIRGTSREARTGILDL